MITATLKLGEESFDTVLQKRKKRVKVHLSTPLSWVSFTGHARPRGRVFSDLLPKKNVSKSRACTYIENSKSTTLYIVGLYNFVLSIFLAETEKIKMKRTVKNNVLQAPRNRLSHQQWPNSEAPKSSQRRPLTPQGHVYISSKELLSRIAALLSSFSLYLPIHCNRKIVGLAILQLFFLFFSFQPFPKSTILLQPDDKYSIN